MSLSWPRWRRGEMFSMFALAGALAGLMQGLWLADGSRWEAERRLTW